MKLRIFTAAAALLALAGCATDSYYADRYDDRYDPYQSGYASYDKCFDCGRVEAIERYYGEGRTSGVGAVTGAVVGGAVGNQVGGGSGRTAATVAGAVIGGIAGNEIEENVREGDHYAVHVRMQDGRMLTVNQRELDGVREGSLVRVSDGRARLY